MKLDKLFTSVVGAASLLAAIVTVYSFLSNEEVKKASVEMFTWSEVFNIPPSYSNKAKEIRNYSYMDIYEDIEEKVGDKLRHTELVEVSKIIEQKYDALWDAPFSRGLRHFDGHTYTKLYNNGELKVSGAVLNLPKKAIVFLRYSDGTTEEFINQSRVAIKDLYQDDLVQVWCWYEDALNENETRQINVKIDSGATYTNVPYSIWDPEQKWFAENYVLLQTLLVVLAFFTLLYFVSFIVDSLAETEEKSQ